MKRGQLIERATNEATTLPTPKCTVGRAEDNQYVVQSRQTSRYHCVIKRDFLGRWSLKQMHKEERGPVRQSATYIRRRGVVSTIVSGQSWKLALGDELAFGRPPGAKEIEFSHVFWFEGA